MDRTECKEQLSPVLFWDVDISQTDMDKYPSFFVQRVLEYGKWSDWNILVNYYGKEKIVNICMNLRSLDPVCLSYICAISNTKDAEMQPMPKMLCNESWEDMKKTIIEEVRKI